jgi:hypothetical protein
MTRHFQASKVEIFDPADAGCYEENHGRTGSFMRSIRRQPDQIFFEKTGTGKCGTALDSPDRLLLVPLAGERFKKRADTELAKIAQ